MANRLTRTGIRLKVIEGGGVPPDAETRSTKWAVICTRPILVPPPRTRFRSLDDVLMAAAH